MSFRADLMQDLQDSFFNENEFGEVVTLTRGVQNYQINGLYDEQSLDGEGVGPEIQAISHRPRLFVSAASLPNGKPRKGDVFTLSETDFHKSLKLVAVECVYEKDGTVVYELKETK